MDVSETTTVYDGGCGGKKANLAAIEDVTPPMVALIHKDGSDGGCGGEISDSERKKERRVKFLFVLV